jgi:outer membrane protein assembly factor BamB
MCFDERDGSFLWQLVVPKLSEDPYYDWPNSGWSSEVTVEGDRVYTVSNRGEVLCLDPQGLANGNQGRFKDELSHQTPKGTNQVALTSRDGDIIWAFDMRAKAGIWSHDGAHSSILIHGDYLYLNTGTGVDNTHRKIRTPDAPSLIVIDKKSGRYIARDEEHIAPNIFHCTWSSPSMGEVNGRPLIFFGGGNGIVYAFEPVTEAPHEGAVAKLKKVWQFDIDPTAPKTEVHRYTTNKREGPSDIFGMPVFVDGRIYIAGGGDIWWGKNEAWLKCIDATKTGDITSTGEIWSYPLNRHVMSTAAVYKGMVFIADIGKTIHCLDAKTGKPYWTHELGGEIWASPYIADGKVYIGTRRGDFWTFAAEKEKKILSSVELKDPISATAVAANGRLYVSTMTDLYALKVK